MRKHMMNRQECFHQLRGMRISVLNSVKMVNCILFDIHNLNTAHYLQRSSGMDTSGLEERLVAD